MTNSSPNETDAKNPDLDRLKARIMALRAKTVENGCTEHEALNAAAKVSELLDQYDLSLTDIEIKNEACESSEYETFMKSSGPMEVCVPTIANFTDCRAWLKKNAFGEICFVFFGRKSDVAVAHYLCDIIHHAMRTELAIFKKTDNYLCYMSSDRRTISKSFLHGMAFSINTKLNDIKTERDKIHHSAGRDLVLVKTSLVDDELARLGVSFTKKRTRRRTIEEKAYHSGQHAGSKISLNTGINSKKQRGLSG